MSHHSLTHSGLLIPAQSPAVKFHSQPPHFSAFSSFPFFFCLLSFVLLLTGCEKNTTSLLQQHLTLSLDYAAVTDVWFNVQTGNIDLPMDFKLLRDDSLVLQGKLNTTDTTLTDTLLLPAHSYSYHLQLYKIGALSALSNELSITTMDTTSHEFQWTSYTFGGYHGSSEFRDVAIVNENDIWAVGDVTGDSLHPELDYNAIHWDRSQWELKQIQFRYFCNQPSTFPAPANCILGFNHDDIFISAGSQFTHWNGKVQDDLECVPVSSYKLWGTDETNIYGVGAIGKIAHYNGTFWQNLESGTDLPIRDIWGALNPSTGETEILAVASLRNQGRKMDLLRISDLQVIPVDTTGLHVNVNSVWFEPSRVYYVAGNGLFRKNRLSDTHWKDLPDLPLIYKEAVRGNSLNDVFIVGDFGMVSHFNGRSWYHYQYNELPLISGAPRFLVNDSVHELITLHRPDWLDVFARG